VENFLRELTAIAPAAGQGAYAFVDASSGCRGWVQVVIRSRSRIEVHRLWTLRPGKGNGSTMLRALCDLADRHGIEITLKTLPFGRKPYPMSKEQLTQWYQRHGFETAGRKLVRRPRAGIATTFQ